MPCPGLRRPAGSKAVAPVSAGTFDSYGLARYHPARVPGGLDRAALYLFSRGRWPAGHVWDGGQRRRASAPVEVLTIDVTARNARPPEFRLEPARHASWAAHEYRQRVRL